MSVKLEICAYSYGDVAAAVTGGADRVEVCCDPAQGGVTPSAGLMVQVKNDFPHIEMIVLIRPRGGNFNYNDREWNVMLRDIAIAKDIGADGIAIGALHGDHTLDLKRMEEVKRTVGNMACVMHRAVDYCSDPEKTIDRLIQLGYQRILTSGGAESVLSGIENIKKMVDRAQGNIEIMPGGGIRAENVNKILSVSGISAIHSSCRNSIVTGDPLQQHHTISEKDVFGLKNKIELFS